jgi:methyl-accepting chemotaxis protein
MMRSSSHPRSIAVRLSWMNALVSGIALLLAYVSFLAYNFVGSRQTAVDNLTGEAQLIGANSVTAILFNDQASAHTTLSALSNSTEVTAAAIYTQSGELFAEYSADGHTQIQPQSIPTGSMRSAWENGIDVLVASRILSEGKPVGIVYIHAHLKGLRVQALRYALITGGILLICLGVALLAGTVFRRLLSEPIVALGRTARLVSRYRDYSLRFEPTQSYSELASLTEAFNEMLSEIQRRDVALEQGRNELELRVEERTAQLRAANREPRTRIIFLHRGSRPAWATRDHKQHLLLDPKSGRRRSPERERPHARPASRLSARDVEYH